MFIFTITVVTIGFITACIIHYISLKRYRAWIGENNLQIEAEEKETEDERGE